jgi:hypothetical protein
LHSCGHSEFQSGYRQEHKVGGDNELESSKQKLKELQLKSASWEKHLKRTRRQYYYLNFYTMREILKMHDIITSSNEEGRNNDDSNLKKKKKKKKKQVENESEEIFDEKKNKEDGEGIHDDSMVDDDDDDDDDANAGGEGDDAGEGDDDEEGDEDEDMLEAMAAIDAANAADNAITGGVDILTSPEVLMICDMGFPPDHAALALSRCDNNVDQAVVYIYIYIAHIYVYICFVYF